MKTQSRPTFKYHKPTVKPTVEELRHGVKEQAVINIFGIAQRIGGVGSAGTWRDGEDVLLEALRRWRDKDLF